MQEVNCIFFETLRKRKVFSRVARGVGYKVKDIVLEKWCSLAKYAITMFYWIFLLMVKHTWSFSWGQGKIHRCSDTRTE
jgi:hypothetical protein